MHSKETLRTRELLDQYLVGQSDAEQELFTKLRSELLRRAERNPLMKRVRRISSIEDVVDDALLRALSSGVFARFQDDRSGAMNNLMEKILENVLVDAIRRRSAMKRGGGLEPLSLNVASGDPVQNAAVAGVASADPSPTSAARAEEIVEHARALLSGQEWEIWRNTELDGLDSRTLAQRLNLSEGAVRGQLRRARAKILKAMSVPENQGALSEDDE